MLITVIAHSKTEFSLISEGVKSDFQESYSGQSAKGLFFSASHFSFKIKRRAFSALYPLWV